jgi:hypothetical protein
VGRLVGWTGLGDGPVLLPVPLSCLAVRGLGEQGERVVVDIPPSQCHWVRRGWSIACS